MAEVLSQSQIDALLSSVIDGGMDIDKAEESTDKKYRNYDFQSPKKFTKDRLKILSSVYESYSRIVTSQINSLFRVNSEVTVATVEEQRYYEFSNALYDNDVLTLINVTLPDESKNPPALMYITPQLMLNMMDRMLGGIGDDTTISSSYTYTDVEINLYESIVKYIIGIMKDAWSNYMNLEFELSGLEVNPSMLRAIGVDETIVIIVMDVDMNGIKGKFNVILSGNLLTAIFKLFDKKSSASNDVAFDKDQSTEEIMDSIRSSSLELKANLGQTQLLLSDIYNLRVGDVINLNKPKDSEIYLYIQDKPWFRGKLGVMNKNMTVKINEVVDD